MRASVSSPSSSSSELGAVASKQSLPDSASPPYAPRLRSRCAARVGAQMSPSVCVRARLGTRLVSPFLRFSRPRSRNFSRASSADPRVGEPRRLPGALRHSTRVCDTSPSLWPARPRSIFENKGGGGARKPPPPPLLLYVVFVWSDRPLRAVVGWRRRDDTWDSELRVGRKTCTRGALDDADPDA